jgi:hypothetical protein
MDNIMYIQRLQALITLIAQKPIQQQACLSDEQLIDFINNELKGRALRQVQQHLHACPLCYQEWQSTCDLMADAPIIKIAQTPHWTQKLTTLFNMKPLFITASALASVLVIVFILPLFYQNSLQQQINQSYLHVQNALSIDDSDIEIIEIVEIAAIDKSSSYFGFAAPVALTAQQVAFRQGVNAGYQGLNQMEISQEKITEINYYEFGRWLVLLAQAAQLDSELSSSFWQQQYAILIGFKQDFIKNKLLVQHLDKLAIILQQLPNPQQLDLYEKLYRYATLMQSLEI